jgi:hypothetical protein
MWTCNFSQNSFCFLKSGISNIHYSFTRNSKLIMNKYLVNENFLTTNLCLNSSIFYLLQVCKKYCNKYSLGTVPYKLKILSKPTIFAQLNSLGSIFIYCNIFCICFALGVIFFKQVFQPILLHALSLFLSSWPLFFIACINE